MRKHNTGEMYICEHCGWSSNYKASLKHHIEAHHSGKEDGRRSRNFTASFLCHTCGKTFARKDSLNEHTLEHEIGLPFRCECGKGYAKERRLEIHRRTSHLRDSSLRCVQCGTTFTNSSSYRSHMKIHKLGKIYPCTVCKKMFARTDDVKRHMLCHTGEQPYKCTMCEKRFRYTFTLKEHIRRHTGDKPYPCRYCTMTFVNKHSLQNHVRKHTGETPYSCQLCGRKFKQKGALNTHMKLLHSGKKSKPVKKVKTGTPQIETPVLATPPNFPSFLDHAAAFCYGRPFQ